MSTDSKYKEFYDNAPTYSEAIAALQDKECPEQVVADFLSRKIWLADYDDYAGDRISPYSYLLSAGIDNRELSSRALVQIFNSQIETIAEELEEFEGRGFNMETIEVIEGCFCGLLEQVNLSSETIDKFLSSIEKVSKVSSDLRDSGTAEEILFVITFGWYAQIFEAIAVHPNSTKEQKYKCLVLSEWMRSKEAEAAED
jgi:hypothetical protein